ncbi:unnamed protein product, partial [marine sediment metagenome]
MLEPVEAEGGVIIPDDKYLAAVRAWCNQKGILLILDEIQTGVGRTGTLFAYEQYGIEPDIMTLAKGLGSGVPVGAILAKDGASVFVPGDHVENRLVGIKSREIYEAPAATVLLQAHQALEAMTLSKDQLRFKQKVAMEYADLIYNGLWFSQLNRDLSAYVLSSQRYVTGAVRLKLFKGNSTIVGRKSPHSLYSFSLATYDRGDQFDQS